MSTYDGKPWWAQPWWRKALFWVLLVGTAIAIVIWKVTRKPLIRRNIERVTDSADVPQSPEQWEEDKARIEAERLERINHGVDAVLDYSAYEVMERFKKRFGRP